MSQSVLPSVSLFLGIIPAFILLYISIKGYDEFYKEKILYLTFIIGCVLGVVSVLVESAVANIGIGIFFIILYPIFEQLLKTIVLNIGRFQEKKETVIYGLCLGLGFGSIFTPFSLVNTAARLQESFTSLDIAWKVVESFGFILIHGATGLFIGYAVYKKKLLHYVSLAILLYIPIVLLTSFSIEKEYYYIGILLLIVLLIYSGLIYWYSTTKILTQIDPTRLRKQRKKKQRKTK